jgi:hypothetical protein
MFAFLANPLLKPLCQALVNAFVAASRKLRTCGYNVHSRDMFGQNRQGVSLVTRVLDSIREKVFYFVRQTDYPCQLTVDRREPGTKPWQEARG